MHAANAKSVTDTPREIAATQVANLVFSGRAANNRGNKINIPITVNFAITSGRIKVSMALTTQGQRRTPVTRRPGLLHGIVRRRCVECCVVHRRGMP